ncbi:MAG: ribulose-phosphate 3-epimerase [Candidatus Bathyarchaeia archaeon]
MRTNIKIAPSIITANMVKLSKEIKKLEEAGADMIHIDVYPLMVFSFKYSELSEVTIGPLILDFLRKRTSLPLEVHLAIEVGKEIIEEYVNLGADIITIHPNAISINEIYDVISLIKDMGIKLGLGTNVTSDISRIKKLSKYADMLLLVTSNPNYSGKIRIKESMTRLRELHEIIGKNVDLAVDGGVNEETAPNFVQEGATVLVVGRYLFESQSYAETINRLRQKCKTFFKPDRSYPHTKEKASLNES